MRFTYSKLGMALAGLYLAIVVAAALWASVLAQTNPVEWEEASLLTFYLTLPFSLILSIAFEVVRAGSLGSSLGLLIVLGVSAVIDAAFLYLLGAALGRRVGAGGRT